MSNSAYTVISDDVEIYQVNQRRLSDRDHRELSSIMIGYSVIITSSLQV